MSKKSTARKSKARSNRRRPETHAPAGLVAAFRMIALDGQTASAARYETGRAYPHARSVIACLNNVSDSDRGSDLALQEQLNAAARGMYESWDDSDPAETANLIAFASFYVGFAVCWQLLTDVNGGVR